MVLEPSKSNSLKVFWKLAICLRSVYIWLFAGKLSTHDKANLASKAVTNMVLINGLGIRRGILVLDVAAGIVVAIWCASLDLRCSSWVFDR